MIIDWAEAGKGGNYEVYPEGTYKVCINGYERVTASTGTEQIRWKASILEPQEYLSKPVTLHTPLTDKSLWKVARLVKACGIDLKGLGKMETNGKKFNQVLDNCLRRTVYWHLSESVDLKGNPRNEIDDFKMDSEQTPLNIEFADDTPEFIKNA